MCVDAHILFHARKSTQEEPKKPRNPGDIHCIGCMQHLHMRMYTSIVQIADYQEIKVFCALKQSIKKMCTNINITEEAPDLEKGGVELTAKLLKSKLQFLF